MKPYFKDSSFDFTQKVFGEPLTQQQSDELKSGKSIQIDRINKNEVPYSLKVHYDDKLNKVIPDKFINTIQQEEKKSKGLKM